MANVAAAEDSLAVCINPVCFRFLKMIQKSVFFNLRSGGWSPNWVHSARRPFTGLLYLPRVIVRMENLVE
jgi:hypothetical protein